jgi:ribosomal protein L17
MKPGDRVELIKNLATKLSGLDWGEVDLVLRQFGLPWSKTWRAGSLYEYALEHLEKGNDAALRGLFEYLFAGQAPSDSTSVDTEGPWTPGRFRLFLSHISSDKKLTSDIKANLERWAIDGFVAHEDIEPTKEWTKEIQTALETCHALVAILTPQFHVSNWTDQEVGYCIKRRVLIVPVMIGVVPYGFMAPYQGLKAEKKGAPEIASELVSILMEHPLSSGHMASAIVSHFEDSYNFNEVRTRMDLVARIKVWTPELLQRLESSIERNGQIKSTYYVPDRIRRIVEQYSRE